MWILTTTETSALAPLTFRVMPGAIKTVGRATGADFILDAPMVSRVHCRVTATPTGDLELEDLDSTNGTFVNDKRVTRAVLTAGDRLRIGRVELVVAKAASS
jgi:pSer/pThr/pTyr-binding forkhead associated (FHA) protein